MHELEKAQRDYPMGTKFKAAHIDSTPIIYTVAGNWRWENNSNKRNIVCDIVEPKEFYTPCLKFGPMWAPIVELAKDFVIEPLIFN